MLNLLTSAETRLADEYTIHHQRITSVKLMEKASEAFVDVLITRFPNIHTSIDIFSGTGNNGGDGLCIARLLWEEGYKNLNICIVRFNSKTSPDFESNLHRLIQSEIPYNELRGNDQLPNPECDILIDAMLGSGVNRPLEGPWLRLINHLNSKNIRVVSVDVPSGFLSEGETTSSFKVLNAELVVAFQRPKINFFLPDAGKVIKEFIIADIGLDEEFIQGQNSHWKLIEKRDIQTLLRPREKFSHKGTYGHALIIAGSEKAMGAALLCSEACVNTGSGLTTACIPKSGSIALNARLPEAMILDQDTELKDLTKFKAIAIGPGLGTHEASQKLFYDALKNGNTPFVADADALTILSEKHDWLADLPKGKCIITPHLKEFDRLFGEHTSWWKRIETAKIKAGELQIIIVLKNRYTFIVSPGGDVLINPTGSPSMATGGMGDVLTGMIVSFLAQGYHLVDAAILAVYVHGKCGEQKKQVVIPASDFIKEIPKVIYNLLN